MATTEAPIHENIKNALVDGDEHGTALIMRSMKNTERVYKNKAAHEVVDIEKQPLHEGGELQTASIPRPVIKDNLLKISFFQI